MKGMLAAVLLGCFVAGTSLHGQLPGKREYSARPLPDESHERAGDQPSAVSPQELFKRLSPSIFVVEALDQKGVVVAFGSGVAVAPDQVVTNEHLTGVAKALRVRQGHNTWPATIAHLDADHDLAQLKVNGLNASPVRVRPSETLRVGERVYAIGAPEGLELTLSDGLVSGLRELGNARIIQTTAAISHGSSGGGLFDTEGRLIGITTFFVREGQNLNFALPAELISSLSSHPLEKTPRVGPQDSVYQAIVWTVAGYEFLSQKKPEQALAAFQQAIRVQPDFPDAWAGLGLAYEDVHEDPEAAKAYEEAVRLKPDVAVFWYSLGLAYQRLRLFDQAINAHEQVVSLKPDYYEAWFRLGSLYWLRGNRGKVLEIYMKLKTLDADQAEKFFHLFVLPS